MPLHHLGSSIGGASLRIVRRRSGRPSASCPGASGPPGAQLPQTPLGHVQPLVQLHDRVGELVKSRPLLLFHLHPLAGSSKEWFPRSLFHFSCLSHPVVLKRPSPAQLLTHIPGASSKPNRLTALFTVNGVCRGGREEKDWKRAAGLSWFPPGGAGRGRNARNRAGDNTMTGLKCTGEDTGSPARGVPRTLVSNSE